MSFDTILLCAAVISMFAVFAGTLIWGDFQTRQARQETPALSQRRPGH